MPETIGRLLHDMGPLDANDSAIDRILDAVRTHLGMEIAFASRFVDDKRQFTHIRSDLPLPVSPGDAEPLEESFCHHILQGRLPELIRDAREIPFARTIPITMALPVGAHLNVPLVMKDGSVYGTFCCVSRSADHSLTDRDLATVKAFAGLAASLIDADRHRLAEEQALRERVDEVLAGQHMAIHLQPIHDLGHGGPAGLECLARFADAERRPPNEWFDDAERVGRGIELELLAVREGLRCLARIPAPFYVSINASPDLVMSGELPALVHGMDRERLVIEITEHTRVEDYAGLARAVETLRPHARIAIDDVGAGYAGLRHILDLRPDLLKLDMSLTRAIDRDPARRALAQAMVLFADDIGARIVAEGVETEGERDCLRAIGIGLGQGWLYARAMPLVNAQQYLLGKVEAPLPEVQAAPIARRA